MAATTGLLLSRSWVPKIGMTFDLHGARTYLTNGPYFTNITRPIFTSVPAMIW